MVALGFTTTLGPESGPGCQPKLPPPGLALALSITVVVTAVHNVVEPLVVSVGVCVQQLVTTLTDKVAEPVHPFV